MSWLTRISLRSRSVVALGLGEGAFLSKPLAVVVIGGLVTSTVLTLIIVPILYLIVEKLRKRREAGGGLDGIVGPGGAMGVPPAWVSR